jgi:serine protease SohB
MTDPKMTEHLQQLAARARNLISPVLPKRWRTDIPVVPVVRLAGIIGISTPLRPGLTLAGVARALDRAFGLGHARAVALAINSPGGSAVQSHFIFQRIRQLAAEKGIPVIGFVEDVAASGGYMIACAADEIICDASSIVGSIGVIGASFGFQDVMKKVGVERRIYTAGEHKSMLDPFLPEDPDDVQRLKTIQQQIHESFIALVKGSRGAKLTLAGLEKTLFSGEYWAGQQALEYGLVDRIGDLRSVLRERFGKDVRMPLISSDRGLFGRRAQGIGGQTGDFWHHSGLAEEFLTAVEARAMWGRFGL